MREERLFSKTYWHAQVQAQRDGMKRKAQALGLTDFARKTPEELAKAIVEECKLDVPTIDDANISAKQEEADVMMQSWRSQAPISVKGLKISVRLPFTGDPDMFGVQPSTYSYGQSLEARVSKDAVWLEISGTDFVQNPPKDQIDKEIAWIKSSLDAQRGPAAALNQEISAGALGAVVARKAELEANRDVLGGLGFKPL